MEFDGCYFSEEDGCRTPKRSGYGVPMKCPAAPKKKTVQSKQKKPPANGYFQSPDIEIFFAMARIRGSFLSPQLSSSHLLFMEEMEKLLDSVLQVVDRNGI
ncbi:hypothetical protein R6Q57_027429 [Mikania cordata]